MDAQTPPEGSLTRDELRRAACRAVPSIPKEDVHTIVAATLEEISEALVRGETVSLRAFGVFKVRAKGERLGRNPATGAEARITPRRVVTFKPSRQLIEKVGADGPADARNRDARLC